MNISRAFDTAGVHVPSVAARARIKALAVGERIADAIAAWWNRRAVPRLAPYAPDRRTLRDIGLTPMGISEEALAALNEAGRRSGARS